MSFSRPPAAIEPAFTKYEEINLGTIADNTKLEAAHGLGEVPKGFLFILQCKIAEDGYSVGDRIVVNPNQNSAASSSFSTCSFDEINVAARSIGVSTLMSIAEEDASGGIVTITRAYWDLIIRVWA